MESIMPVFFEIPKNVEIQTTLKDYIDTKIVFNPKDKSHTNLIRDAVNQVNLKLEELQTIDKHVVGGFATAIAGFLTSFIFPVGIITTLGFGYAAYYLAKRSEAYQEYNNALNNLCLTASWTLGSIPKENVQGIKDSPQISDMITALAPLTSKDQLAALIDDKYEAGFLAQSAAVNENKKETLFDRALNQEERHVYYGIYGLDQGNTLDILKGMWYLGGQAVNYFIDTYHSYMNAEPAPVTPAAK